jgi:hypothetical protein
MPTNIRKKPAAVTSTNETNYVAIANSGCFSGQCFFAFSASWRGELNNMKPMQFGKGEQYVLASLCKTNMMIP